MEQELERLRNENHRLKEELTSLKEKETNQSFKEKYAVRILESLPDMLTVFNHEGTGIGVVSSEETNHVGVPNSAFAGMHMRDMIPEEAYHNVYNNLQKVIATGKGSTAHHELDVNGAHHYYENRIFPLDEEYVLIMCRDISERVVTQKNLEVFKRVLDKVSDSILAASTDGTLVYANKQFIEEYGVFLGVPVYGFDWPLPFREGVTRGESISPQEALALARRHGAEIRYDETAQAPWFRYTAAEGREHEVWFEDARSSYAKFRLAAEKGLQGVGLWNLMRPAPQTYLALHGGFEIEVMR